MLFMVATLRTDAPSYATIKSWVAEFKHGRESLEDDPHSGINDCVALN